MLGHEGTRGLFYLSINEIGDKIKSILTTYEVK
jgi:hypothetical protein